MKDMKAALTSINPPNTNNIIDKIKGIEWRKKPMPRGKHYCYETKNCFGLGKVIGEFTVQRIKKYENVSCIPKRYVDLGCVPIEFLEAYSKGKPLYAHFIIAPKRYDEPKELNEFIKPCVNDLYCESCAMYSEYNETCGNKALRISRPPQSWCYVKKRSDNNAK